MIMLQHRLQSTYPGFCIIFYCQPLQTIIEDDLCQGPVFCNYPDVMNRLQFLKKGKVTFE